jgi:hypothetical protein
MGTKKAIYQEISNYQLDKYTNAVIELTDYYNQKLNDDDLETFYTELEDILENFDNDVYDHYNFMPKLLKDKLFKVYKTFGDKQNKKGWNKQ